MGADEPQEIRRAVSGAAAVAIRDIVSKNPVAAGHFDGREATEVVARGDVTIVYFGDEWTSATMPRWIEGVPESASAAARTACSSAGALGAESRRQSARSAAAPGARLGSGGYYELTTLAARPVSEAPVGAEVLVEIPGEGIWRAARVERPPGFLCPAHQVSLRPLSGRLSCRQCEMESGRQAAAALVESLGSGKPTLLPAAGIRGVTGYAWAVRPLDEAARECQVDGGGAWRYGYGQGEIEPAPEADWLFDRALHGSDAVEHVVVTLGPQAPSLPPRWGVEPLRPLRPRVLNEDPARPVFSVRPVGPIEELQDWTLQAWVYAVGVAS